MDLLDPIGEFRFKCRPSRNYWQAKPEHKFVAWAAPTEDLKNGPLEVDISLMVFFDFGTTYDEALGKVRSEVMKHLSFGMPKLEPLFLKGSKDA